MKNKICIFLLIFFSNFVTKSFAENIIITAKNISLDKNDNTSIFQDEVVVETQNKIIKSDFAKYDRKNGYLLLEKNITIEDEKNNKLFTNFAEYYEIDEKFKTKGETKIITEEKYLLEGQDFLIDNKKKIINSDKSSILEDQEGNKVRS